METGLSEKKPADYLAEQRTSNELVKRIHKLRWMGMEEEAKRAQDELTVRPAAADSVVSSPCDTD